MATSGSINFSVTRNDIINNALQIAKVIGGDEIASNADIGFASDLLNMLVKSWQKKYDSLSHIDEGTIFLEDGQVQYSLNGSSGDQAALTSGVIKTELSADEATSSTTIDVDSSTGMAASDIIGIELDDGTLHWSTISSVDSATQVTIASGVASAASTDNHVYTFTTYLNRPLDILSARIKDADGNDQVLTKINRQEYFEINNKTTESQPLMFYYDRQRATGELYVWPSPDSRKDRLLITFRRSIEDFDASSDNPDYPIEWVEALTYQLALRIAVTFGSSNTQEIAVLASQMLQDAADTDVETASMSIAPDLRGC